MNNDIDEYKENFKITVHKYYREYYREYRDNRIYILYETTFNTKLLPSVPETDLFDIDKVIHIILTRYKQFYSSLYEILNKKHLFLDEDVNRIMDFLLTTAELALKDKKEKENFQRLRKITFNDIDFKLFYEIVLRLITDATKQLITVETLNFIVHILRSSSLAVDKIEKIKNRIQILLEDIKNKSQKYKDENFNTLNYEVAFLLNVDSLFNEILENKTIDYITLSQINYDYTFISDNYVDESNNLVPVYDNKVFTNMNSNINSIFKRKGYFKDQELSSFLTNNLKIDEKAMDEIIKSDKFKKFVEKILENAKTIYYEEFMQSDLIAKDLNNSNIHRTQNETVELESFQKVLNSEKVKKELLESPLYEKEEKERLEVKYKEKKEEYDSIEYLKDCYPYYFFEGLLLGLKAYIKISTLTYNKNDRKASVLKRIENKLGQLSIDKDGYKIQMLEYLKFLLQNSDNRELLIVVHIAHSLQLEKNDAKELSIILKFDKNFDQYYQKLYDDLYIKCFKYNK